MRLIGGIVLLIGAAALSWWSLAIGFFNFDVLRWGGGAVGVVLAITAWDVITDDPHPWWRGGKSSFLGGD